MGGSRRKNVSFEEKLCVGILFTSLSKIMEKTFDGHGTVPGQTREISRSFSREFPILRWCLPAFVPVSPGWALPVLGDTGRRRREKEEMGRRKEGFGVSGLRLHPNVLTLT